MSVCRIYWPQSRRSLGSRLKMGLAVTIISLGGRTAFGRNGSPQLTGKWTLCIHVYESVGVSSGTVDYASKEAARILRAAGVPTVWDKASPDVTEGNRTLLAESAGSDGRNCLVVWIARRTPGNAVSGALGSALLYTHSGPDITIFYDQIERLEWRAISAGARASQVLGYAMAHEVGHVLLGSTGHSPAGIMKGRWGQAEFERLAKAWLGFTPQQSAMMRESAFRRAVFEPRKRRE